MSPFVFAQLKLIWIYLALDMITCETEVLNENLSWLESKEMCNLATPIFEQTDAGDLKVNDAIGISKDTWAGYFKAATAFEYKACIPNAGFKERKTLARMTKGLCYQACGWNNIFGIREKSCYCETDLSYDERLSYSSPQNCVSIYKVNKQVVKDFNSDIDDDLCLMIKSSTSYKWVSCDQNYKKRFCSNDTARLSNKGNNWEANSKLCFKNSSSALTYNEIKAINKTFHDWLWTSIVCSYVIYKHKDYDSRLPKIRFGYLSKKEKETTVLKFKSKHTQHTQHEALCIKGSIRHEGKLTSTESTTYSNTTYVQMSKQTKSQRNHDGSSSDKGSGMQTSSPETEAYSGTTLVNVSSKRVHDQMNVKLNSNNNDSGVSRVIICVSIGAVVFVIIVAAVVVVFKKRRSSAPEISGTEHDVVFSNKKSSGMVVKEVTHDETSPHLYDASCYSQTYYAGADDKQVTESVIEDNTYDTTKVERNGGMKRSENIYNRLGTDETYDSTSPPENNTDNIDSKDTYGKLHQDTDSTYNIASIQKGSKLVAKNVNNKTGKDVEETYDRVCNK